MENYGAIDANNIIMKSIDVVMIMGLVIDADWTYRHSIYFIFYYCI
jgi:hypothetical protein